ncbi:MAG: hypothetical protein ACP5P4_06195 [Steroidobacteraceae bacterium]
MSEVRAVPESLEVGLLLDTVQSQQRLAGETLAQLDVQLQSLERVVRAEVARAAHEAFLEISVEADEVRARLGGLHRTLGTRTAVWSVAAALASAVVAVLAVRLLTPTSAQIDALRARRALFAADIRRLREYGGAVELRRCGARGRLCVRVQRTGPAFGAHGNFLLVKAP